MKKAQISMNMIVYIAIALLVLVLIVAFVSGGFGQMFKGVSKSAPQDLETIQSVCTNDCNKAKALVETSGTNVWKSSKYCSMRHGYDADRSGDIIGDSEYYACWQAPVNIDCSVSTRGFVEVDNPADPVLSGPSKNNADCIYDYTKDDGTHVGEDQKWGGTCAWIPLEFNKESIEQTVTLSEINCEE